MKLTPSQMLQESDSCRNRCFLNVDGNCFQVKKESKIKVRADRNIAVNTSLQCLS